MATPQPPTASAQDNAFDRLDLLLAGAAGLITLAIVLVYRPWSQPAVGDLAMFQVFGRLIADGAVPYQDFFDTKAPLASYLNASAALASDWFGFDYVYGARGLSILLTAVGGALVYTVSRHAGIERFSALVAATLFLAADGFAWSAAIGFEPKALMWVFGAAGLVAAYRGWWWASGILCALGFLTWQPAGTFLIGAAATTLLIESKQRPRALVTLGASFIMPLLLFCGYLLLAGAFDEFWTYTFTFSATYIPPPPFPPFDTWADVVNHAASNDRWLFLVAAIGFVAWVGMFAYMTARQRYVSREALWQVPLVVVTASVLGYSTLNFAGWGDFFPFVPWVAIWCGWLLHSIRRLGPIGAALGVIGAVALVCYGHFTLVDQTVLQSPEQTLGWQRDRIDALEDAVPLGESDKIYAVNNMAWYVLLSEHENTTEFLYTWDGIPNYIVDEYGSFAPITAPLEEGTPRLVILGFHAVPEVREAAAANYAQIDPFWLPGYFQNRAEFWIRNDLIGAGSTVQTLAGGSEVQETCLQPVDWQQAGREAGQTASVSGPVTSIKRGKLGSYLLEIGQGKKFFIILDRRALAHLDAPVEQMFEDKTVCARGSVRTQLGAATITVYDANALLIVAG